MSSGASEERNATASMIDARNVLVVGGTAGIGREVAKRYADQGRTVVLTGRDAGPAEALAKEIGGDARGLAVELAKPDSIAGALADIGTVDALVLVAIDRDANTAKDYDIARAAYL